MTYFVDGSTEGLSALVGSYDPTCGCSYWTSTSRPAHGDGCVPVRSSRLPAGLVARQLHTAHEAGASGALDAWAHERPTRRPSTLDRWVAEASDERERLYRSLNDAVREAGIVGLPDGFVDLAISVGLARLAIAEQLVPGHPELAERVNALEEDLPRLVATALDAAAANAIPRPQENPPSTGRDELVAEVTAELGPRLMEEIHKAVTTAVAHGLEEGR